MKSYRPVLLAAALVAAFWPGPGRWTVARLSAQEVELPRTLVPGKGVELTTTRCVICHDAQHITRAKLSREEWDFNIKNMIERGAPIAPDEVPVILEYLATYYNRDTAAPATAEPAATSPQPVQALLTSNACVACHQLAQRTLGPSFREVAAKFANDATAAQTLSKKIREGGAGNWGAVPMPPHPQLSDADLHQIVTWVLEQK